MRFGKIRELFAAVTYGHAFVGRDRGEGCSEDWTVAPFDVSSSFAARRRKRDGIRLRLFDLTSLVLQRRTLQPRAYIVVVVAKKGGRNEQQKPETEMVPVRRTVSSIMMLSPNAKRRKRVNYAHGSGVGDLMIREGKARRCSRRTCESVSSGTHWHWHSLRLTK